MLEDRSVPAAVAVTGGLVSWWTADNTANDLNGMNHATLVSGAGYAPGVVGQAFSLDGINDRVEMIDSESLKLTGSMTIEGWIKIDSLPTQHGEIFFRGDDRGGLDPYQLSVEPNGTIRFQVNNVINQSMKVETGVPLGQWLHVAATLDDDTGMMSLYLNGTLADQHVTHIRPFADLDPNSNPGVAIGNHGGYPNTPHNFPFDGLIDELSIYSRALTAGEVRGIHAAGAAGKVRGANVLATDFPSALEGTSTTAPTLTFTITRIGDPSGTVVADWTTTDGTATAGVDYVAASGQVVFLPGEMVKTVQVQLLGDTVPESTESFWLTVTTPTAGWETGSGLGAVLNDDTTITIANATVTEGDTSGQFLDVFIPDSSELNSPRGMTVGPDGLLYVANTFSSSVTRYNADTGAFAGTFVATSSGGLSTPVDLVFGADGHLYVSSSVTDEILRYDGTTGAFLGAFVSAGSGGLDRPSDLVFGTGGHLYVSSGNTGEVLRYDGATGAFLGVFVPAGSGGLNSPRGLFFHTDGLLYVVDYTGDKVLRYNGTTGAFVDVFVPFRSGGLTAPSDLAFGPDGHLYVNGDQSNSTHRYHGTTGESLGTYFAAGSGGVDGPRDMIFRPDGTLLVSSRNTDQILRYGPASYAMVTVSLSVPSAVPVTVNFTTVDGTAIAGVDYTAVSGTLVFAPGVTTRTIIVPTLNDALVEGNEAFTVVLSAPTGAVIANGSGQVSIQDNDPPPAFTKFYVVDDGGDNTLEYAPDGSLEESYGLASGNSAPRGVATTAAGVTVWVIDNNDYVYVYDTAGNLLRSWKALGLKTPEGIATDGVDVWIVDRGTDQVYHFAGGANRTTNASSTSTFKLHQHNRNPYGITTDGTHLWVVDDANVDRVFKYTVGGTLLGSWQIDSANVQPRGITIDPSNVDDIWIVDASTDRVYRYAGAASRTSGSQSAADEFALAPGNTNPQGIADPPPPAQSDTGEGVTASRTPPRWWLAPPGSPALTARHTEVMPIAHYEPVPAAVRVAPLRANAAWMSPPSGRDPVSWNRGDLPWWMELALPVDVDGDRDYPVPRSVGG